MSSSSVSVSVLLPVYNGQDRLERGVAEILDVLPELAPRFDLMIIDDGSTDDTIEVAQHLAMRYPQVAVVRHAWRLGLAESVQTGLDNTNGDIVFVGDEKFGLDPDDLRKLWPLRKERDLVLASHPSASSEPVRIQWMEKLLNWKSRNRDARAEIQMIRRRDLEALTEPDTTSPEMNRRIDRAMRTNTPRPKMGPLFGQNQRRPPLPYRGA